MDSIDVISFKDIGYPRLDKLSISKFFRKAFERGDSENIKLVVTREKLIDFFLSESKSQIELSFFKRDLDLWKDTRSTMSIKGPVCLDVSKNNDLLRNLFLSNDTYELNTFASDKHRQISNAWAFSRAFFSSFISILSECIELLDLSFDFRIPEDDKDLEKMILFEKTDNFDGFTFSVFLEKNNKGRYLNNLSSEFSNVRFSWKLLLNDDDVKKMQARIELKRKFKFANSQEAIDQTIDRKAYLIKAAEEFCNFYEDVDKIEE